MTEIQNILQHTKLASLFLFVKQHTTVIAPAKHLSLMTIKKYVFVKIIKIRLGLLGRIRF